MNHGLRTHVHSCARKQSVFALSSTDHRIQRERVSQEAGTQHDGFSGCVVGSQMHRLPTSNILESSDETWFETQVQIHFAESHLENIVVDVKRAKHGDWFEHGILDVEMASSRKTRTNSWNHVDLRECRQQRNRWKFLQYLHLRPPPLEHVFEMTCSQEQRRRRCGSQDGDLT